jgi:hypothetical protein
VKESADGLPSIDEMVEIATMDSAARLLIPPVDLEALATEIGICVERCELRGYMGQTGRHYGGYVVSLREGLSSERERFTLAHEIGHALLDRLGIPLESQTHLPSIEVLCNGFANELLVPRNWLAESTSLPLTVGAIGRVAREAVASSTVAFISIASVHDCWALLSFLRWNSQSRHWECTRTLATTAKALDPIITRDSLRTICEPWRLPETGSISMQVLLKGRPVPVHGEFERRGMGMDLLIDLKSHRRIQAFRNQLS